ncbi:MAG: hypothetical protein ACJAV1_000703 [Paraglaciecola sp.]|jgi:hypothetical protein
MCVIDGTTYHSSKIETVMDNDMHYLFVAKPGDHKYLYEWIENECFNSLKNQGYELTHHYGDGKSNLSLNMYLLTLLALTFHQVFELTDGMYQVYREVSGAKTRMWAT